MKLGKLLQKLDYHFEDMQGGIVTDPAVRAALLDREITDITNDSRKVSEGGLFFCTGAIRYKYGTVDINEFGRIYKKMPLTCGLLVVAALSK